MKHARVEFSILSCALPFLILLFYTFGRYVFYFMKCFINPFGIVFLFISTLHFQVMGQGCSDAGFCSIGNLAIQGKDSLDQKQKITFSIPIGRGDESVVVLTPSIQYDNLISDEFTVQVKVTGNYAAGSLGKASGPGDIYLSGIYSFNNKKIKTSVTIGTKLPLNSGNLQSQGRSFPMQYQSSLGTVDMIAGLSAVYRSWQFSVGLQQPVSGTNGNNFLPVHWEGEEAGRYPPSNNFNRKADILLRTAHNFFVGERFSLNAGLLGIYHLGEDTYTDTSVDDHPVSIKGSEGVTVNMTLAVYWEMSDRLKLGFTTGVPLVVREVRPDGLTRSFVVAPELRWSF
jgi:hypothetical protein